MARTIPVFQEAFAVAVPSQEGLRSLSAELEMLTPMMGGGWRPLVTEAADVVRGQALRGHLRFWWRATRAARYTETDKMLAHEVLLWGSTDLPSAVQIRVELADAGRPTQLPVHPFRDGDSCIPPYVGFPMPNSKDKQTGQMPQGGLLWEGVRFKLVLSFPAELKRPLKQDKWVNVPVEELDPEAEVAAALWAWSHFGGLGARTRRGCGAIQAVQGVEDSAAALRKALEAGLAKHVAEGHGPPEGVACLIDAKRQPGAHLVLCHQEGSAMRSWQSLIRTYKDYRQARRKGSDDPRRPGRSYWCEPDHLRRLTKQAAPNHKTKVNEVNKAPRAAFGLPIVFHFKDNMDPGDHQLQGADHDRLASPLILRPLRVKGGAVALALRLRHDCSQGLVPSTLVFAEGRRQQHPTNHKLTEADATELKKQSNIGDTLLKLQHLDPVSDFLQLLAKR